MSNSPCVFLSLIVLFAACEQIQVPKGLFLTDTAGGKVVWYPNLNKPHAIHFEGTTYVTFPGSGAHYLDPMVIAYDHNQKKIEGPVKVGDNPLAPHEDTHGNPAIMISDDGFLHVIFGGHGNYPGGNMIHAISKKPGDISQWKYLDNINPIATYPQLVKTEDGVMYYFYRKEHESAGNHRGDWVYVSSNDHGRTFSDEVALLEGGEERTDSVHVDGLYYDAWYATIYLGQANDVHLIAQYHPCVHPLKDPYHAQRRFNLYHMVMEKHSGVWKSLSKRELELPINAYEVDSSSLVGTSEQIKNPEEMTIFSVANLDTDSIGYPYILMSKGKGKQGRKDRRDLLLVGDIETGEWRTVPTPMAGKLIHRTSGNLEIWANQVIVSEDDGATWEMLNRFPDVPMAGLSEVSNSSKDARVVAYDNNSKGPLGRKIYLWGEGGFIQKE